MIAQEELNEIDNPGLLVSNQQLVEGLQKALVEAPMDLSILCRSVEEVLRREPPAFMDRLDHHTGARYRYKREEVEKWIKDERPSGLQTDKATLFRLIGDHPVRVLLNQALMREQGGANNPDGCKGKPEDGAGINGCNATIDSPVGPQHSKPRVRNDVSHSVRRLTRAANGDPDKGVSPDPKCAALLDEIKTGQKSVNAAMIEAGFRKKPTPLDILRKAWKDASPDQRATFLAEVNDETKE